MRSIFKDEVFFFFLHEINIYFSANISPHMCVIKMLLELWVLFESLGSALAAECQMTALFFHSSSEAKLWS